MRFEEKVRKCTHEQLWKEYCGYADISLDDYMYIQRNLMTEQIQLWSGCGLGRKLLEGRSLDDQDLIGSLREALENLDKDRKYLTAGGVFDDDQIDSYIELKMAEVMRFEMTPHPVEFDMYYSA